MAAILAFSCLLVNYPLLPRLGENILLNFESKNEATEANWQENKRILKWRPFWNRVYRIRTRTNNQDQSLFTLQWKHSLKPILGKKESHRCREVAAMARFKGVIWQFFLGG